MVRVAVEAVHQQDMDQLELGLSRLYQADPAVEVRHYPLSLLPFVVTGRSSCEKGVVVQGHRSGYRAVELRSAGLNLNSLKSVATGGAGRGLLQLVLLKQLGGSCAILTRFNSKRCRYRTATLMGYGLAWPVVRLSPGRGSMENSCPLSSPLSNACVFQRF